MRLMRRLGPLFVLACAAAVSPTHAQSTEHTDACIAHIRAAITPQRSGSHLPLLFSLRQLGDPSLVPFFEKLVDHPDWQVQVHAVLGLAEIHPNGLVDQRLLSRIAPSAQDAVIASAIDLRLLDLDQMTKLLAIEDLSELSRLMLHAESNLMLREIDRDDVRRFVDHDDLRVAGLASLLLAQSGEPAAFASFQSRYTQAGPRTQNIVLPWLLDAIRQYRLTVASDWLRSHLRSSNIPQRDRQYVVLAAFEIDPVGNLDLWREHLGESPTYAQRVRAGFILLAAARDAPTAAFDDLLRNNSNDELLVRMAAAGRALTNGNNAGQALIDLIDLGHPRTTEWVMSVLKDDEGPAAQRVYRHIIEQVQRDGQTRGGQAERVGLAVTATARLFSMDPEWVSSKLLDKDTDLVLQQALLLGMFESDSHLAANAAAALNVIGVGREASLRTLLIAKHVDSLDRHTLRQLGVVAAGGGRVSDVLRAQAAWLYLKHSGQIDAALQQLFAS